MQNKITKDNIKFAFLAFMEQIAYIEFVCYWHPSSASTPVDIIATETYRFIRHLLCGGDTMLAAKMKTYIWGSYHLNCSQFNVPAFLRLRVLRCFFFSIWIIIFPSLGLTFLQEKNIKIKYSILILGQ